MCNAVIETWVGHVGVRIIFFAKVPMRLHASSQNLEDEERVPDEFGRSWDSGAVSSRGTPLFIRLVFWQDYLGHFI